MGCYLKALSVTGMLSRILDDPLMSGCGLPQVAKLKEDLDKANVAVQYVISSGVWGGDEGIDKALSDLNRPTFDPSRPTKLYLVARIVSPIIDDYPESTCYLDIVTVEAVSEADAAELGRRRMKRKHALDDMDVYGPFDNKTEAEKVASYLDIEWENSFPDGDPLVDDTRTWFRYVSSKPVFNRRMNRN